MRDTPAKLRILLIDDDATFRPVARVMLEAAGYEAQEADDGAMGLAYYRQHPSNLVITDILMPGMGGFETVIMLRRLDPNEKLIAITAAHERSASYLNTVQKLGATGTLKKPFSQAELLAAVTGALRA